MKICFILFWVHFPRVYFKIANLKGSIKTNEIIVVGSLHETTSDCFVLKIARLHQQLLDIVNHFNYCYSIQVFRCVFFLQIHFSDDSMIEISFPFISVYGTGHWHLYLHLAYIFRFLQRFLFSALPSIHISQ